MLYTQGFGSYPENVEIPVISNSLPPSSTTGAIYPIGKRWIDQSTNTAYTLTSISAFDGLLTYTWQVSAGGSAIVATVSGNTGTASPSAGNISIVGAATQLTTAASGSTLTISVTDPFDIADLGVSGNATIGGTLGVTGTTTMTNAVVTSALTVDGTALVTGNFTTDGAIATIGSGASTVNISGPAIQVTPTSMTMSVGLNVDVALVASGYTVLASDFYVSINSLSGASTINLPLAPIIGQVLTICDVGGAAATNNITINGNGKLIDSSGVAPAATTAITTNFGTCFMIFNSLRWSVIART
jgi:hypothetical protein